MSDALAKLTFAYEHAADPILVTHADFDNPDGPTIAYCNTAFTEQVGWTRSQIVGRSPKFLQSGETDRATLWRIRDNLLAGKPVRETILNFTKYRTPYYAEIHISYIYDDEKQIAFAVSLQRDVTKFVNYNKALQSEIEYNKILFDESPYAKIIITYQGEILKFNRTARMLFGHEDLTGHDYRILLPENLKREHELHHRTFLQSVSPEMPFDMFGDRIVFGRRKSGEQIPLSVSLRKFRYQDLDSVIIACKDQSVLYEKKQSLRALIQELEKEKNAALGEYRSQSMFLMNMSHELRTPLNSVLGFCQLLEISGLDDKQIEYTNYIRSAGEILLHQYE